MEDTRERGETRAEALEDCGRGRRASGISSKRCPQADRLWEFTILSQHLEQAGGVIGGSKSSLASSTSTVMHEVSRG